MSRYSKQELDKLKKGQLLELIRRQPEVGFPRRIGSGPLDSLSVRQLRTALSGPHGYVKPASSLEGSQATSAATPAFQETITVYGRNSSSLPSSSSPEFEVAEIPMPEIVSQLAKSVQGVSLDSEASADQGGTHSDSLADSPPFCQDVSMEEVKSEMNLILGLTPASEPILETQPSPPASSGTVDDLLEPYPSDSKGDENLLDEYFARNPSLLDKFTRVKAHRRKHQSDNTLVRDYRFNIALYEQLMARQWENDTGRILGKKILAYLDISPPWLARARKIVALIDRLGPSSPNPDPRVVERLSSNAITNKGEDILKFLMNREVEAKRNL